ncbi:MAG: MoxR family ATPase [Chloroherpetonaceae bacterium]|nr:MoxR family ATPase [Chloroherpetonaceae bacterium]MDW8438443.1 MoxR family ATPase [Chloroherpetonaceae bacterium]
MTTEQEIRSLLDKIPALKKEIQKVIVGQDEALDELLAAFFAGGHALLEGVPGLAKTLMIRSLANAVSLSFRRIQFTPDLMPADILGTEVLEEERATGRRFFKFNQGPIFANIVLADEINRAPPKTQSALLEAMQERSVTLSGKTYSLEQPFFVLATQNPIEQAGTYPLPEAQLDRFLLHLKLDYPSEEDEARILAQTTGAETPELSPVLTAEELRAIQRLAREVVISSDLLNLVNRLVRETRPQTTSFDFIRQNLEWGAGTRAGQALILAAKAFALAQGRFSVLPSDIRRMALPALRHRVILNFKAQAEKLTADDITRALLSRFRLS